MAIITNRPLDNQKIRAAGGMTAQPGAAMVQTTPETQKTLAAGLNGPAAAPPVSVPTGVPAPAAEKIPTGVSAPAASSPATPATPADPTVPTSTAEPTATTPAAPTGTAPGGSMSTPADPGNQFGGLSLYEWVRTLYGGRKPELPETPDRTGDITALYDSLMGLLPENRDYSAEIGSLYDAQREAALARLEEEYNKTQAALREAGANIGGAYRDQRQALAAENMRQRANMNEQMAASGLNVGAGSQAQLAQNAAYMSGTAGINQSQAEAQASLEREMAAKEAEYQSAITSALRDNDYQKALALTQELKDYQQRAMQLASMGINIGMAGASAMQSEWNRQAQEAWQKAQMGMELSAEERSALLSAMYGDRQMGLESAKLLAGYGDFSGFESLYGKETADRMRELWLAQNPDFAYMTGQMTAEDYYRLTGKQAPGTTPTTTYTPTATTPTTTTEPEPTRPLPGDGGTSPAPGTPVSYGLTADGAAALGARSREELLNILRGINLGTLTDADRSRISRLWESLDDGPNAGTR